MRLVHKCAVLILSLIASGQAGVSWKALWIEPFDINMHPGEKRSYAVKGLALGDHLADLSRSAYLTISSSDEAVIAIDHDNLQLLGRSPGTAQVILKFGRITSSYTAVVSAASSAYP